MKVRQASVLRGALSLLSARRVLEQIGLVMLVAALCLLWLHVPDASAMDVLGTVLLGLVVIWVGGAGETALFLGLCDRSRTKVRLLRGAVLLLVGFGLWLGACSLVGHLESGDSLRAGYLNSRASAGWRNVFSFNHILLWLGWMWTAIEWIVAGVLAGFVFPLLAAAKPIAAMRRVLRSLAYWGVLVLGTAVASFVTGLLMAWTPGHGLRVETVSLVLRLVAAVTIDSTIAVFLLAVVAVCVRLDNSAYGAPAKPAGTPDVSQPRTVDNP